MKKTIQILSLIFLSLAPSMGFAWTILVISKPGLVSINGTPGKVGDRLKESDVVVTGKNTKVKLIEGRSILVIGESSKVSIETKKLGKIKIVETDKETLPQVFLQAGKARFQIDSTEAKKYRFRIPSVVSGVRGTEFFLSASTEKEVLCVLEGEVGAKIISNQQEAKVTKGIGWIREGEKEGVLIETTEEQRKDWVQATDLPQ